MAATMTRKEVTEATGKSRSTLFSMAKANDFTFKQATKMDEVVEAPLVELIRECISLGLSRRQATLRMKISFTLLTRLIRDYSIEYKKAG
jgi:hypothetical protein